jgi:putative transposase
MLWKPNKLTRAQMEERRLEGGRMLKRHRLSPARIAHRLGVSRTAVSQWKRKIRTGGLRRLHSRLSQGRPTKLTPSQTQALLRQLKCGALAAGFPTDRWTLGRLQQLIKREFKVVYHPNYLNRLLHKLGWTVQQPVPRAKEQDEELVAAWLEHAWPRIKKKHIGMVRKS